MPVYVVFTNCDARLLERWRITSKRELSDDEIRDLMVPVVEEIEGIQIEFAGEEATDEWNRAVVEVERVEEV